MHKEILDFKPENFVVSILLKERITVELSATRNKDRWIRNHV